jgi:hypothetical protein
VLNLLLQHVRYRDNYASSSFRDSVSIHGPYRLDAIIIGSFTLSDAASAETTISTWAEEVVPVPDTEREELQRELYPRIHNASCCYRLPTWERVRYTTGETSSEKLAFTSLSSSTIAQEPWRW